MQFTLLHGQHCLLYITTTKHNLNTIKLGVLFSLLWGQDVGRYRLTV